MLIGLDRLVILSSRTLKSVVAGGYRAGDAASLTAGTKTRTPDAGWKKVSRASAHSEPSSLRACCTVPRRAGLAPTGPRKAPFLSSPIICNVSDAKIAPPAAHKNRSEGSFAEDANAVAHLSTL